MSGKWLALIELVLVFALVFGWGLNELRGLRRDARRRASDGDGRPEEERAGER